MAASGKKSSPGSKTTKGDAKPKRTSRPKSSPSNKTDNAPKKRRRSSANTKKAVAAKAATPSPTSILVVDNGGDALKYGWLDSDQPQHLANVTARLKHQWTVLVGDELKTTSDPNQMHFITRSTERGIVTNLGNQVQVWKRMLDRLGVVIPEHTEASQAFGWNKVTRKVTKQQQQPAPETPKIPAALVAVLLLVPPHCPRSVLDQMMYVWMEDFGVSHVGFATTQICATKPHPDYQSGCVVDLGWSATNIVPTFKGRAIVDGAPIRRIPLGGRHLVNVWKYYASYRQWNLMDQERILRDVFEQLGYVSLDFQRELEQSQQTPQGRRPFDRNFVLPDYQTTHRGHVELTPALKREAEILRKKKQQQLEEEAEEADDDDEEDDEDFEDTKMEEDVELELEGDDENEEMEEDPAETNDGDKAQEEKAAPDAGDKEEEGEGKKGKKRAKKKKRKKTKKDKDDNDDDEDDDDEDGDSDNDDNNKAMLRQRLLRQKQEEERRRLELEAEQQVLTVSVERFTVPEVLFLPSDAGLPVEMAGLAHAIVQSIKACPKYLQPALFRSIQLTGGVAQLQNLTERLERELRALTPAQFEVKLTMAEKPIDQAWLGARDWARKTPYTQWSVSRDEWEAGQKRKAWTKLLASNDGILV